MRLFEYVKDNEACLTTSLFYITILLFYLYLVVNYNVLLLKGM